MHRLLLVLLLFLPLQNSDPAPSLRAMTFNLRYASEVGEHKWSTRRPLAAELIATERPDLLGTQEGVYAQIKDLDHDLPDYDWIGLGRDGGSHGEFMAIFYRRERFEPLEFDHFWLSDTPDRIGSTTWGNKNRRMVTWVRFRERETGRQLYCINTHFDHRVAEARAKSADLLRERVGTLDPELPIVLLGDFNAPAGSSPPYRKLVTEGPFDDSWAEAVEQGDEVGTFHGYAGPRAGARIDWVLTRGFEAARSARILTFSRNGAYPSDHFPVVADVPWT